MMIVSKLKAVIFDFDGVILESVHIKTKAFQRLFADYPDHLEQITQFHLANGGISRFEKFAVIYRDFLKLPLTAAQADHLAQQFAELVITEVLNCPFVPGAAEFLATCSKYYPLFVASATPHEEIQEIVTHRNLSHFFQGIYGSPQSKRAIIQEILRANNWPARQVLFVGDAINDYEAANQNRIRFIGRVGPDQINLFPEDVPVVEDLAMLNRRWTELVGDDGTIG